MAVDMETDGKQKSVGAARRRRAQATRAQRRHVTWLLSLLQSTGHHTTEEKPVKPEQPPRQDDLQFRVAGLEEGIAAIKAVLAGLVQTHTEPFITKLPNVVEEPQSQDVTMEVPISSSTSTTVAQGPSRRVTSGHRPSQVLALSYGGFSKEMARGGVVASGRWASLVGVSAK